MTRVAITTTAESFQRVAPEFARVGLEPVSLPCIRIEECDRGEIDRLRAAAAEADLIVLTSRRTVDILWPNRDMPATPVAAVGSATSHAAADAGGNLVSVGSGGGASLVELLSPRLVGATVVYPHAHRADPALAEDLRMQATMLIEGSVYDTVPIAPGDDPVDVVTFASPSAVEGWTMTRTLDPVVLSIGPTTTAALDRLGRSPDLIADDPTFTALAMAIARHQRSSE